ncbi:hypothetical protein WS68_16495 [Burkholderia sp. TSV86]|nr:hypothetical protein WS68_16495 [Burkholderia sp. TSV86]
MAGKAAMADKVATVRQDWMHWMACVTVAAEGAAEMAGQEDMAAEAGMGDLHRIFSSLCASAMQIAWSCGHWTVKGGAAARQAVEAGVAAVGGMAHALTFPPASTPLPPERTGVPGWRALRVRGGRRLRCMCLLLDELPPKNHSSKRNLC